jgi:glycosyltransferase involved in cell wall biosynthesis
MRKVPISKKKKISRVNSVLPIRKIATHSRAVFTICSWNYLGYALTLSQSLAKTNPELPFYIFIADRPNVDLSKKLQGHNVIVVDAKIAPDFESMALRYTIMEYNTSVKPYCFDFLFDNLGCQSVIYLDPDILVLERLEEIYADLESGMDCVLTPHITAPLDDGKQPDDLAISRAGIYNLGFVGLANRPQTRRFVTWWRRWLSTDCVVDFSRGVFVDQRFCDFAPSFIEKTRILHDPGYNLAYWNLLHRPVVRLHGVLCAGGSVIKFVHFSGFNKNNPKEFSKHQNRFTRKTIGELGPIFDAYVISIKANDIYNGGSFSQIPYGFRASSGLIEGVAINGIMRACLNRFEEVLPAGTSLRDLTGAFFASPFDQNENKEKPISRLLYEIYESRADLQIAFDLKTEEGKSGLWDWAKNTGHREMGVPIKWIAPSKQQTVEEVASQFIKKTINNARGEFERIKQRFKPLMEVRPSIWRKLRPAAMERKHQQQDAQLNSIVKNGLAIYGFLHTETGIGQASRSLSTAFATTGMPMSNHALIPTGFKNNVEFPVETNLSNNFDTALLAINADNVTHLTTYMDPGYVAANRRLGLFFWELPVFPGIWSSAIEKLDEVWVSTSFVKDSLSTATSKPVHVVPLPVPLNNLDTEESRASLKLPKGRLIYLATFDFNSYPQRKNPIAAVRAFIDAFPKAGTSSPLLVVKCHGAQNRKQHEADLHAAINGRANIMLIDRVMSKLEMLQLQAACDVHISLHRSEGFGLNLAEAMASGKLAIGTNFSGNLDFMSHTNSLLVDFKMQQLKKDDYVLWQGQWWAEPSHDHAVAAIRQAKSRTLRQKLGVRARRDVADALSFERVGAIMQKLIEVSK